jgi:hypothetical protein
VGEETLQRLPQHGISPWACAWRPQVQQTLEEPDDIRVEQRSAFVECNGEHSIRYVMTNPGKCQQGRFRPRHTAAVSLNKGAREGGQTPAAMQEAQRAEKLCHLIWSRFREISRLRIGADETVKESGDEVSSRSLQEQFSDQHAVGIALLPPGEPSTRRIKPGEDVSRKPPLA